MKKLTLILLIGGGILVSLALMIFGPYGSMNPSESGFYTSIGAGILWFIISYYAFKKYLVVKSDDEFGDKP